MWAVVYTWMQAVCVFLWVALLKAHQALGAHERFGEVAAARKAPMHRPYYNGALYICNNENGTPIPGATSPDIWLFYGI
jgi:hypothetical protein